MPTVVCWVPRAAGDDEERTAREPTPLCKWNCLHALDIPGSFGDGLAAVEDRSVGLVSIGLAAVGIQSIWPLLAALVTNPLIVANDAKRIQRSQLNAIDTIDKKDGLDD